MTEFDLIERYLSALGAARPDVVLAVGDDAALARVPSGAALRAVGASGRIELAPAALATALVDEAGEALERVGARAAWATLALSMERADEAWLDAFASSFDAALRGRGVCCIGGDTTAGPLAVTLHMIGVVDAP